MNAIDVRCIEQAEQKRAKRCVRRLAEADRGGWLFYPCKFEIALLQ